MKTMTSRSWLVAALAGTALLAGGSRLLAEPRVGKPAPIFTAETVDGKKVDLAEYKGKSAVLLNFYANF